MLWGPIKSPKTFSYIVVVIGCAGWLQSLQPKTSRGRRRVVELRPVPRLRVVTGCDRTEHIPIASECIGGFQYKLFRHHRITLVALHFTFQHLTTPILYMLILFLFQKEESMITYTIRHFLHACCHLNPMHSLKTMRTV